MIKAFKNSCLGVFVSQLGDRMMALPSEENLQTKIVQTFSLISYLVMCASVQISPPNKEKKKENGFSERLLLSMSLIVLKCLSYQ